MSDTSPTPKADAGVMQPAWEIQWQQENQQLTLKNVRALAWIALILMMGASTLDHFSYPHLWTHFFIIRSAVGLMEIGLMFASYTAFGRRHYPALMLMVPLLPAVGIAYMIFCSGNPSSPYYSGLTLCLVGFAFLFQWGFRESVLAVGITMTIFLAATLPHVASATREIIGQFLSNGVFLIMNSVVVISGSHVHQRIRRNEVISRYSLADNQKELEQKNLQLVEMDRLKTDFFSNITHELRTPLTLMIAPLQRLQRQYPADSSPLTNGSTSSSGLHDELGGIYQNALRLLKLINDLLDLASANVGRLRLVHQRFSLKLFTGRLLQSVSNMAKQGDVEAHQEMPAHLDMVDSDQEKLEKILLNLLFNAVKFTPKGGRVSLITREEKDHLVFEVIDTGIGISQQNLPFIFDRFWQADSSVTRRHPGTGLGLALVKELVTRMGGRVEASSVQGQGTTMRVSLPFIRNHDLMVLGQAPVDDEPNEAGPAQQNPAPGAEVPASKEGGPDAAQWIKSVYREAEELQMSDEVAPISTPLGAAADEVVDSGDRAKLPLVLIVDDEPGMLRFMHAELEPRYRVIQAADGAAGLELAKERVPDLIIADYMMPNLDGLALCREIRITPVTLMLPIMLVTARSDEDVRLTALRNGANDV
ncbi:MAG TPA: ATP-binding protein, partial [Verrucomicrobium sp.]|nr:ATP-binding protein [Verrucomicrobium sp.]